MLGLFTDVDECSGCASNAGATAAFNPGICGSRNSFGVSASTFTRAPGSNATRCRPSPFRSFGTKMPFLKLTGSLPLPSRG
jgi:hypothetical protein